MVLFFWKQDNVFYLSRKSSSTLFYGLLTILLIGMHITRILAIY